ncbi:MAG: aryl-alcohol dehydrogenase [Candidatus Binatota bacterium]|jgi:aryl-alcohol dehydrogenase|nr:aryl-alcohol dehydrogenase [Candidatus Binatota bacterium]
MKIQAAVLRAGDKPYSLERLELAGPGADEILVRMVGTGMCHTDMVPRSPEFAALAPLPLVTGHEGAGVVEAIGQGVATVQVGDHVVLSFDSCGTCTNCRGGHPAYCESFMARNLSGRYPDGNSPAIDEAGNPVGARWFGQSSFATHALATSRNAVVVDRTLPLELLGPLGCGIQTGAGSVLIALRVRAGGTIAIYGAGAVGLSAVMAARVAGATTIIAVDLHPPRLELARELGATHTIDGAASDVAEQILSLTGGVEHAFDTTGIPSVIVRAISALRPRGVCGLVGVRGADLVLPPLALELGRTVTGIIEGDAIPQRFIPQLIALWRQNHFPFDRLIRKFPFAEIDEAERASLAGEVVKPVLVQAG